MWSRVAACKGRCLAGILLVGVFSLAVLGCGFEEWGITVENHTDYAVTEILLSATGEIGTEYRISFPEALQPGESRDYFWVDYGEYGYFRLKGTTGTGEPVEVAATALSEALKVDFPGKARLILRISADGQGSAR